MKEANLEITPTLIVAPEVDLLLLATEVVLELKLLDKVAKPTAGVGENR